MHWHILEIIEPGIADAAPARASRYVLLVQGPFAYLPGEGEQYMTATYCGGRWQLTPNTGANPRRGTSPGG